MKASMKACTCERPSQRGGSGKLCAKRSMSVRCKAFQDRIKGGYHLPLCKTCYAKRRAQPSGDNWRCKYGEREEMNEITEVTVQMHKYPRSTCRWSSHPRSCKIPDKRQNANYGAGVGTWETMGDVLCNRRLLIGQCINPVAGAGLF